MVNSFRYQVSGDVRLASGEAEGGLDAALAEVKPEYGCAVCLERGDARAEETSVLIVHGDSDDERGVLRRAHSRCVESRIVTRADMFRARWQLPGRSYREARAAMAETVTPGWWEHHPALFLDDTGLATWEGGLSEVWAAAGFSRAVAGSLPASLPPDSRFRVFLNGRTLAAVGLADAEGQVIGPDDKV
jgi:hypothetical protein